MAAQDTIKALRKRVADLESEVIHLKRELAGRAPAHVDAVNVAGQRDGHGARCQCIGCRAGR